MSRAMAFTGLLLTVSGSLRGAGVARAAAADDLPRLDERTAFMIGAQRLKLGVLAFDYGIAERVSIGTDPPAWAARAFLPVLIPNLHLKVSVYQRGPIALSVQGGVYYLRLNDNGSATGSLVAAPLSLFASFQVQSARLATRRRDVQLRARSRRRRSATRPASADRSRRKPRRQD